MEAARAATPRDLDVLTTLAAALIAELAPTRGGDLYARREAPPEPLASYFSHLLEATPGGVVVGTIDDVIVGFGCAHVEQLRDGTSLGVIRELYVEVPARAIGVGEAIVNALIDFCRTAGCSGVDASALPGNRAAKNFFETHGFVARSITMHRSLGLAP